MAFYFETLTVWQKSYQLVKDVFQSVKKFPKEELYSLVDQIKRSALSIPSNIAEWCGRTGVAERNYFYSIAKWSTMELQTQLMISQDMWYISSEQLQEYSQTNEEIVKMLHAMISKSTNNLP